MQPYDDASLDAVLPYVLAVVGIAATNASFTALALPAAMPPNAARYHLVIEPVAVAYELRFGAEVAGLTVPANTFLRLPFPIARSQLAQVKLASGSATVRCLVAWPDRG